LKRFKNIFRKFDINNDGTISIEEMYEIMKQIGLKLERKELVDQIKRFDYDENNQIDYDEFLCLMSILINETNPNLELQEAFDIFDINGDSFITKEDLKEFLKRNGLNDKFHNELIKDIIKYSDFDGDSRINFEEFYIIHKYTTMINNQFDIFSKKRQKSQSLVKDVKLYR
jgi:Ca2+-binding EF-hand superfamily protein